MPCCAAVRRHRSGVTAMAQQETELITEDRSYRFDVTKVFDGDKCEIGYIAAWATELNGQWFLVGDWECEARDEHIEGLDWMLARLAIWALHLT